MLKRSITIIAMAASFVLAAPAHADGTGKGPTHNAPAPLTPQSYTVYPNQHGVTHYQGAPALTVSHSGCSHSQANHVSHSGLATNPHPVCYGHAQTVTHHAPAPVTYTQAPIVHAPVQQPMMMVDTSSFTGGVGVGVNDVFVGGGGFFGGGAVGSTFGARASGAFAGRNVALSRSLSGFRGARRGNNFKGGGRGGVRGGGRRGGRGGGGRRGGR